MKNLLTALVLTSSLLGASAHATNSRPDIGFVIRNNTDHDVTFRGDTYCADFPGTLVVKARSVRPLIWGEGVQSGSCAFLAKGIVLTADRYTFKLDTAAPTTKTPGYNGKWTFDVYGNGDITVNKNYYQSSDLVIEMSVNR